MTKKKKDTNLLQFKRGNAKLFKWVHTFSIISGHTCPGAKDCLSKRDMKSGKLIDGPDQKFRCFSATQEVAFPSVWAFRKDNFDKLLKARTKEKMVELIEASLDAEKDVKCVRIHIGGDFFSQTYFNAWTEVASKRSDVIFYAYTKSVNFWVARLGDIPSNFVLTASLGGRYDDLIKTHSLRKAVVVYSEEEAELLGLEIDHDDTHAMTDGGDFALLIHGQGKAGSKHSAAVKKLREEGKKFSYSGKNTSTSLTKSLKTFDEIFKDKLPIVNS